MRIDLRCLWKLHRETSRREWEIQLGMQKRAQGWSLLSGSHQQRVKDSCEKISSFGFLWSLTLSVVSRISYWKAMSRNFSPYITSTKCHRYAKWNYWGQTQKPTNKFSSHILLFTCLVSICASVIKQLFLLLGTSLFGHPGLPSGSGRSHFKDLPQRPQNRSNCISTWTVISLPEGIFLTSNPANP